MSVQSIFRAALEQTDLSLRADSLDRACAGDPDLRRRVEELLRAYDQASGSLERLIADPDETADVTAHEVATTPPEPHPPAEAIGSRIGPYKLLQLIGEGGMGVVYMAEQDKPIRRRVALKIIKAGMDTSQVIARFEAERQALALMDHPNIAKVLDAGATGTGRPYFIMELVKGVAITEYCDRNRLTPRERLALFAPVCQAIQHAHQKGIIHRDIKPSNILVAHHDGNPVAKVIDFGVAKATDQRLTERTMFTEYGQIIGTLEYMSPEQAEMGTLDIDTRSDIYSLGVVLYELLTGGTPLQRANYLGEDALAIKEFERAVALRRALGPDDPQTLDSMNNLAHGYRYASRVADALTLHEQTLKARKARLGPDATDTLISMGELASTFQAAGRLGDAIPLMQETLERMQAKLGTDHPHTLSTMNNLAGAYQEAGRIADALPVYEDALRRFKAKLGTEHPETLIAMNNLAWAYRAAGRSAEAIPLIEEALKVRRVKLGTDHPNTLQSMADLAVAYQDSGRLDEAIALHEQTFEIRRAKLGADHAETLTTLSYLAKAYGDKGRTAEAVAMAEEAARGFKARLGSEHPYTLQALSNVAHFHLVLRPARAEALFREVLAAREKTMPDDWRTFDSRALLGQSLFAQKKYAEAEPLLVSGYEGMKSREGKIPSPARKRLTETAARIVDLYNALGTPDKAAKLRTKLAPTASDKNHPKS